jgi:hypothetical protein
MKRILYFIITIVFVVGLTGCSSKPPKMKDNESLKQFENRISNYYSEKILKDTDNKDIEEYLNKSNKIFDDFKKKFKTIKDKDKLVDLVDNTIEKLIDLSDKYINISEDDYEYLANPIKYYLNSEDINNLPPAFRNTINNNNIGFQIWNELQMGISRLYYKEMISPFEIFYYVVNKNYADKYRYIISHSKYKKFSYIRE